MAKTATARTFPIVLKSIIADTHKDDATFTRNDKQIRATLRAKLNDDHVKNTSWIANNQREYDRIRCAYDATYATRLENARTRKPRAKKVTPPAEPAIAE